MIFGRSKKEYEAAVKATNKLRAELEKMRLENALLRDQIRAITGLPPELSSLYVFVQEKQSVKLSDIRANPRFSKVDEQELLKRLTMLGQKGLVDTTEKGGETYYSIRTPDMSESWTPKPDGRRVNSSAIAQPEDFMKRFDEGY